MSGAGTRTGEMPDDPRLRWATLSQAERDAAYDNNAAVANSAELIAERNAASARLRAERAGALDVPYAGSERTRFDLYPVPGYGAPCLVFLHGGYWQRNSREVFALLVEGLAARGWAVAIPGYTLAPEATLTRIVSEIGLALDWLAGNAVHYGMGGPVVLAGWSAGAQLTALALSHPHVTAGLAISGVYELEPIRDTILNRALNLTDEEIAMLSPLRLPAVPKPLAIAYGTAEVPALVCDSLRFHALRGAAGAPGPLVPVEGADHFTILDHLRRPDGCLVETARALVQGHRS